MAGRVLSPLNEAIRKLCADTNGTITHGEARPSLKEMGFEIAEQPPKKSSEVTQFETECDKYNVKDPNDPAQVKELHQIVCGSLNWPYNGKTYKAVMAEIAVRKAFEDERNNFDVTKFNWKQSNANGTSAKPAGSTDTKAKTAAQATRNGVPARPAAAAAPKPPARQPARPAVVRTAPAADPSTWDMDAVVEFLRKNGGTDKVSKDVAAKLGKAEQLKAEAAKVEDSAAMSKAVLDRLAAIKAKLAEAA